MVGTRRLVLCSLEEAAQLVVELVDVVLADPLAFASLWKSEQK